MYDFKSQNLFTDQVFKNDKNIGLGPTFLGPCESITYVVYFQLVFVGKMVSLKTFCFYGFVRFRFVMFQGPLTGVTERLSPFLRGPNVCEYSYPDQKI